MNVCHPMVLYMLIEFARYLVDRGINRDAHKLTGHPCKKKK